ncbi:MAG: class I SAM-dependent rRNA methyltransferase [Elusimicrobiota bacterium]
MSEQKNKTITLKKEASRRLSSGHLWLFSNEIAQIPAGIASGDIVEFRDFRGNFAAKGFINKNSLIAGRVLTFRNEDINYEFIKKRVASALEFRKQFFPQRTSLRIIFGESDFLPGLLVDKFEDTLVLQNNCLGMENLLPLIIEALKELIKPAAIYQKSAGYFRTLEGMGDVSKWELGEKEMPLLIDEWGLKFNVDIIGGQKTGFYFDQSENHFFVRNLSKGKKVLDCFSYTGAFSLNAKKGGASEVTAVDESEDAIALARENSKINKLSGIKFIKEDVFNFLENTQEKFDLIILDPPSFTKSRKNVPVALKGYIRLNKLAFKTAVEGGIVLSASCSHHISREEFLWAIKSAAAISGRVVHPALARKSGVHFLGWRGASADHPVYLPMPETDYLKMAILRVS